MRCGAPWARGRVAPPWPQPVAPAVLLAVALSGPARAADECGPAEAGQPLTCSSATYDPSSGGNIFYGPDDPFEDDFEIQLTGDLSVRYDRNARGDDVLIRRLGAAGSSAEARSRYGAVVIAPRGGRTTVRTSRCLALPISPQTGVEYEPGPGWSRPTRAP